MNDEVNNNNNKNNKNKNTYFEGHSPFREPTFPPHIYWYTFLDV